MDPALIKAVPVTFTDAEMLLVLALILAVIQFLYRVWDKKDSKATIEAITAQGEATNRAIMATIETFQPHLERGRKVYGMLKDLQSMHSVRDDDGRFIWYMPKEIIETQRELARLTHIVATTQSHMLKIMERQEQLMAAGHEELKKIITTHQDDCKNQYHTLREDIIT